MHDFAWTIAYDATKVAYKNLHTKLKIDLYIYIYANLESKIIFLQKKGFIIL